MQRKIRLYFVLNLVPRVLFQQTPVNIRVLLTIFKRVPEIFFFYSQPHVDSNNKFSLTYLLTPWSRVLLEILTGLQLVKEFLAFYVTRRFITAFTSARQLSLSSASSIQSIPVHPTSWRRSILILSSHLSLGFPSGLFPSGSHCISNLSNLIEPMGSD